MAFGYGDPRYERKKNLEAWHRFAPAGMTVTQYYSDNFAEPWIMSPFAAAIEGDRSYLIDREIDSVYFLIFSSGFWWNHSLNTYLAGRCFYDASLDPFDLIEDYTRHYYGPKAGPLLAKYFDQWARDPDLCYRIRGNTTPHDRKLLAEQRKELIDPAARAAESDPVHAHRVGKAAALHALAERFADGHRMRQQIQVARHQGDFAKAAALLDQARRQTDGTMAMCNDMAGRNEGLFDMKVVGTFVQANVQGWLDAEAKAIAAKDGRVNEAELPKELDEADAAIPPPG
jgi:hypothetical protein